MLDSALSEPQGPCQPIGGSLPGKHSSSSGHSSPPLAHQPCSTCPVPSPDLTSLPPSLTAPATQGSLLFQYTSPRG